MDVSRIDGGRIVSIPSFLTLNECETWVGRAERLGFHHAWVGVGGPREAVPQSLTELVGDGVTESLFGRARQALPERWFEHGREWDLTGFHNRLRFYRYEPSDRIPIHQDDPVVITDDHRSWLTLLVFLNECSGGSIQFHRDRDGSGGPWSHVPPRPGTAAFFPHETWHDAADVIAGRKYLLRADVLYRRETDR